MAIGIRNYIFHPMRMHDAILPGHTSPGNIKGSANHACSLFLFLLASSKVRLAYTRENILSLFPGTILTADRGTFHIERAHFNICSSENISYQLFLPLKSNRTQSCRLSTKFLHRYGQLSYLLL